MSEFQRVTSNVWKVTALFLCVFSIAFNTTIEGKKLEICIALRIFVII